ncbi:MAG: dihydroorotate dehydrogenase [Gemmatimonadales bacterium]|jgi:dihydroorotate dehydrogenase (NAD+) catalytic subunit|nr:MAG: dihydroorotate dehydrogenase [Gemmatimonadales bacterium]
MPDPVQILGTRFWNPVLLAAGTCGFGQEVSGVVDLEQLGGLVTKSVTLEPRKGNRAPRVTEFGAGMLNSIGLANPGAHAVRHEKLPWLARNLTRCQVLVSVAGHRTDEYHRVVEILDDADGFAAFELNLSCPNDTARGGLPFALDPEAVTEVVAGCRTRTERPLVVKLAPNDPVLPETARRAQEAGADGFTLVNTLPGRILNHRGTPVLGAGQGGVSGPALRPVGVQAVASVRAAVGLPILGVGGILNTDHALEYLHAGASLVQMGTVTFASPRQPEKVARELSRSGWPRAAVRARAASASLSSQRKAAG